MVLPTIRFRAGVLIALVLGVATLGHAQYSASVQGTVTDGNGAVVQSATVTLTNIATNITNIATTSSDGAYHFQNLLPADYKITVSAPGFAQATTTRHVSTDEIAGVNIALVVGATTTTVEVTASAGEEGLNPSETRLQYTLEAKDINNMPLPDRATLTSIRVAPGVVGTIETTGSTNTNIPIGQAAPDARGNGRPAASNVYLLDRIPISSTENTGAVNMVPNPDMLSEIALQTNNFTVDNGSTSSLQIDFTSKSGSNKYHGDFDMSYTSKPFEASPDFGGVSPFHRKYYMGSFGGPVLKDKAFFFGSVERVQNLSALGGSGSGFSAAGIGAWGATAAFPKPAAFEKLFTYAPSNLTNQTVTTTAASFYPASGGQSAGLKCDDPSTFMLPCSTPVTVSGTFNQNPGITGQQYNLRYDHSFRNDNDRVYISYFGTQQDSDYIDTRPAFNTKTPSQTYYFSAGYSHVFTANLTNQLNAGLNRYWGGSVANPNYAIFPHATLLANQDFSGGYFSADTPYLGADSKEHFLALRDYATWIHGKHLFQFGFQSSIRNYWQNSSANYSRPYGTYFSDLLEMLQGKADETSLYTIGASGSTAGKWTSQVYGAQQVQYSGYAQDAWKIKSNLDVTFGIRWDDYGNPSQYGDGAAAYSNTFLAAGSSLYAQVAGASARLVSSAFNGAQLWNFLPRAAFSYSPAAVKNMVIRGGIGLYQDSINLNQITANLPTTTPVRLTLTLHDNAEAFGSCFFCGGTKPWTGTSSVAGEPAPFAFTGTQGVSAPYGIPYPLIPVTGISARGLALNGASTYQSDMYGVDPDLKPQSTTIWNLAVEKELPNAVVVGANYSGSYSNNLFLQSNSFDAPPVSIQSGKAPWSDVGKVNLIRNMLSSNYNALVLTAQQRKGGLNWQASYLWSHALGNPGTGANPSPYNATASYGTTSLDVHQRITLSGSYQLTEEKGNAGLFKGLTLGGVVIAQGGTPFTVYSSQDVNGDGQKDGKNDLPNVVFQSGSGLHYGKYSNDQWKAGIFGACGGGQFVSGQPNGKSGNLYSAASYPNCPFQTVATPDATTLEGNEQYNAFRNPGYWDVDLNLQKKIEMPWFGDAKSHLNLRFEALNAFNHANLNGVGTGIIIGGTSNFGEATSATNPRILQFGGRFEF